MIQDIYPHRLANEFQSDAVPVAGDLVFYVRGQEVAARRIGEHALEFPRLDACVGLDAREELDAREGPFLRTGNAEGSLAFLFALDGRPCWLASDEMGEPPAGFEYMHSRALRMEYRVPREQMYAAYTAIHLADWYAKNRFCGACGHRFEHHGAMRALTCPACGNVVFPRLNPAIIACVCDPAAQKIVLTRYAAGRYHAIDALVAGFVEIGETVEECVHREVREELGLEVKNVRYYKSQPWGVAGDVLMGFWCDVDGDSTIHRDSSELGRAVWAGPDEIAGQPDDLSLTNEMMCLWRDTHR
jgi:NAD+ diphosphatase